MHVYTPGLGSLVVCSPLAVGILLVVVGILFRSGKRTGVVRPVAGIRMSPGSVPLSGVWRWTALVPLLLGVPAVVLSVFSPVGVLMAGVRPGVTSVIHDGFTLLLLEHLRSEQMLFQNKIYTKWIFILCLFGYLQLRRSQSTAATATSFHWELTPWADNRSAW